MNRRNFDLEKVFGSSGASLEDQRATHQEIPDGPIVIDKDLLQEIRNHLAYDARDKANTSSELLLNKLNKIYPFLC